MPLYTAAVRTRPSLHVRMRVLAPVRPTTLPRPAIHHDGMVAPPHSRRRPTERSKPRRDRDSRPKPDYAANISAGAAPEHHIGIVTRHVNQARTHRHNLDRARLGDHAVILIVLQVSV